MTKHTFTDLLGRDFSVQVDLDADGDDLLSIEDQGHHPIMLFCHTDAIELAKVLLRYGAHGRVEHVDCPDCDGTGTVNPGHFQCYSCGGTGEMSGSTTHDAHDATLGSLWKMARW